MGKTYANIKVSNIDELQEELKKALELSDQLRGSLLKIGSWNPELKS